MAVSYGLCSSGILQTGRNCRRLYRVSVYTGDELYVYVGEWKSENDEVQFIMGYVKRRNARWQRKSIMQSDVGGLQGYSSRGMSVKKK